MSGHSKWSTIKHKKAAEDKKRGRLFSRLTRAITIAAREGGADPKANAKLRFAIEQAKGVNMPNANIQRAINKGAKKEGGALWETIFYEGFGPEKVALIVECITDSKNRTGAMIKSFFERNGGGLGSTNYLFEKKGFFAVEKDKDLETQMLKLIDLGADDIDEKGDYLKLYSPADKFREIQNEIEQLGFVIKKADLIFKPINFTHIADLDKQEKISSFLERLNELEDVQKVYCNADFIAS